MNKIIKPALFLYLIFSCLGCFSQLITNKTTLDHMELMFDKTRKLADNRADKLFSVFYKGLTENESLAMKFLYAYMPLSDLADYVGDYYLANVRMSLKAREEMVWGKKIPEDVFLHFVLPIRVNNENLDSFRILMYQELKQRVKGLSMKDAALEVNHWCHEKVTYKPSDDRTSSPLSTIRYSFGRCGEESTFTVAAMRMIGIPARQVYTPRWAHSDDNHAWVEVWVDGKWYFMGACEPDPDLNMGWFAGPAARAILVHTRAYGWYNGSEPAITSSDRYSELNLIANYAPVKSFYVKVTDSIGKPVSNAKVEYQLYNYAEFYPVAKTFTDEKGITGITSGLGDLLIWANLGNAYGYKKITVENTDTLVISLLNNHPVDITEDEDFIPPVERAIMQVSDKGRKENQKRLHDEDSMRTNYMAAFKDTSWCSSFAKALYMNPDSTKIFIMKSYGNWKEISGFLQSTEQGKRYLALKMLSVISDKDLRDAKAYVLKDHLNNAFGYNDGLATENPDFFAKYIMSCRIGNEMITDWRSFLLSKFSQGFIIQSKKNPLIIADWIKKNITVDQLDNAHSRAPLTPRGVFDLKVADNRSRDIFFVAICRCFGIPSRLNPETMVPQYWFGGDWNNMVFESNTQVKSAKGYIHFVNGSEKINPKYTIHFTIGFFKDGVYRTLQFDEGKPLKDFPDKVEVETGKYILVTGNRLPDGSVLSRTVYFNVRQYEVKTVEVNIREKVIAEKPWGKIDLPAFELEKYSDRNKINLGSVSGDKGCVLIFIEPDKEPSKHVMADIEPVKSTIEKWKGNIFFILSKDKTSRSFKPESYKGLPSQSIFAWDKNDRLFSAIEKAKGRSLGNDYPVIVMTDHDGNLIYFSSGYRIGTGEQLVKKMVTD